MSSNVLPKPNIGLGGAYPQRCVVHRVDYHALVLRAIFRPSSNVGLDDVTAVEEGLQFLMLASASKSV